MLRSGFAVLKSAEISIVQAFGEVARQSIPTTTDRVQVTGSGTIFYSQVFGERSENGIHVDVNASAILSTNHIQA